MLSSEAVGALNGGDPSVQYAQMMVDCGAPFFNGGLELSGRWKKVVARCNQATNHETEELPLLYILCWRYDMSIGGSGGVVVMQVVMICLCTGHDVKLIVEMLKVESCNGKNTNQFESCNGI